MNSRHTVASALAAAALLAGCDVASASTGAGCPTDIESLSTSEVGTLLSQWKLGKAFADEFEQQEVDGFALLHVRPDTVDKTAYPNAQPFHWEVLWSRLARCEGATETASSRTVQDAVLATDGSAAPTASRRRLTESSSEVAAPSGIRIRSNHSSLSFGPNSDVVLKRTADNELTADTNVRFCDGNGIRFCNNKGEDPLITSDAQGNIYISGNVHFLSNTTFRGIELDSFVKNVYEEINPVTESDAESGLQSCAAILGVNSSATSGVYDVDGQYVYCDMTDGGWTLLASYNPSYGYLGDFNAGTPTVLDSSGGSAPPTDEVWAPLVDGDYGHVNMTKFDLSNNRTAKGTCTRSSTVYSYETTLFSEWVGGVSGNYQGNLAGEDIGWAVLSATDVGMYGLANHFICGSGAYSAAEGIGFCDGVAASSSWTPHMASISFWPTSAIVGCAGGQGTSFQFWVQ